MVQYYYDKYNTNTSYASQPSWGGGASADASFFPDGYKNISWNGSKWVTSVQWGYSEKVYAGSVAYSISGTILTKYTVNTPNNDSNTANVPHYVTKYTASATLAPSVSYSRGALVQPNVIAEDGTYPTNGRHTDGFWYVRGSVANSSPTVTLTSPSNNQTLYENDTINISGDAYDADKDQSVTAYYQINAEPRKVLATNLSQTLIALSKQLTFKGGKLYDGGTAITGTLAEGVAHTLKVWAVDSENASSTVVERSFYVVPNRAPSLMVNNPTPNGIIDSDSFNISGTYGDADGNATTVVYRINGGNPIQIAQGVSGDFTFDLTLGALKVGLNAITVEATDSYGAKTTKTVKLNKTAVTAPLLRSTVRYKVEPPTGSASEILVWVQRDAKLTLDASVSMTIAGEPEAFVPMTAGNTASLQNGQVEDEFYYAADGAKDSIVLKLDLTKSNVNADEAITLITGVF